MVGGSSSLRRGAVPSYRRRSWSLSRRVRAAQRETAQLMAPALTAVKSRLPTTGPGPWAIFPRTNETANSANVSSRTVKAKKSNAGLMKKHRSPSRSPNRTTTSRFSKSWTQMESSNAKLRLWAQRSKTEISSISRRLRNASSQQKKDICPQSQLPKIDPVSEVKSSSQLSAELVEDTISLGHEHNGSTSSLSTDDALNFSSKDDTPHTIQTSIVASNVRTKKKKVWHTILIYLNSVTFKNIMYIYFLFIKRKLIYYKCQLIHISYRK